MKSLRLRTRRNTKHSLPTKPAIKGEPSSFLNGIETEPEVESIQIDAKNIACFSLPQEVLSFNPGPGEVRSTFKNGVTERKIYSNTELTPGEQTQLKVCQEEAKRQGKKFSPFVAAAVMRYVTRAAGDAKKALREMQSTEDWRRTYFRDGPISDASIACDMQHGVVYFSARDRSLRPTLVIRPGRMPSSWGKDSSRLTRVIVFSMEYLVRYLCLPGRVECASVIVDLAGVTMSTISLGGVREMITVLSQHYLYRVHKFYLCNVPNFISRMSSMLMRMLTERQKQKIFVVRNPAEIQNDFALHHLELDLGGNRPMIDKFFPYPLLAGPFEGNCDRGADPSAIPNLHEAITAEGFHGHAWDPMLTLEENRQIEYSDAARHILQQCGLAFHESSNHKAKSEMDEEFEVDPPSHKMLSANVGDIAVKEVMPDTLSTRTSISSDDIGFSGTDERSQLGSVASASVVLDFAQEDCEVAPALCLFGCSCDVARNEKNTSPMRMSL